jgi:molybdate transport system substrate-binding protein
MSVTRRLTSGCLAAVAALLIPCQPQTRAQGSPVRVLSSNGFKAVIDALGPQCERAIGHTLALRFGTSTSLRQRMDAGDAFDVAIVTAEAMDDLSKAGKVSASTRAGLGRSGIGVGARSGSRKPDIRTAEALKATLVAARSITYAGDGASRPHIEKMLGALGIADVMTKKTLLEQGSVRAAAKVASGDAELLITLISEILPAPGVELVGALPAEFQHYVSFAAAAGAKAANPEAGKALIACLSGPGVAATLKAKGIDKP